MAIWNSSTNRLTNPFFSLTLEPRQGGRIVSLTTPDGELTVGAAPDDLNRARSPYHFGLLSLQLWQDSYWHNDLCHSEWPITSVNEDSGSVAVTLSGASALWPGVAATRTITITDAPWLDITFALDTGPTTDHYLPPAFWFSSAMAGRGRTFIPGPAGVLAYPRWPQDQSWCHEPTDGWIAWIGDAGGLAFVTDADHLRHVRVCHRATDRVEWVRRRVASRTNNSVPHSQTANVRVIPFPALTRVDGVGPAGIMAAQATPTSLMVDVYALASGDTDLVVEFVAPDGESAVFAEANTSLVAGTVSRIALSGARAPFAATWLRGTLAIHTAQGDVQTIFTLPLENSSQYLRGALPSTTPAAELPRDSSRLRPPRSFNFNAAPAPLPDPWVRRQGDRPRVLALVEPENTATLLALAHEFDFDMTLPFLPRSASAPTGTGGIGGQRLYYELGDRFDTLYGDELIDAWAAALDSSQTYDAIILNCYVPNVGWALLPESLQSNILARVAAGTGLVVIRRGEPVGPTSATADLDALLPLGVVNESDYQGFCQPIDDRTIRGLPWEILPASGRIFKYSARSNAEVLLKINYGSEQLPLLARSTASGGRVLDLAWAGGRFLIPPDSYRDRQDGTTGMDLSRYDLALIARIICDAAGREPSVAISNVALDGDSATVDLESTATTSNTFDLSWVARDRFGLILGQEVQSLDPITGANTISFDIPSGTWTLDLVTQPMDGGEPGWGAGGRPLDFTVALNPNATAFDPDAAPQITTAVIEASGEYVLELLDGRGRILERVNLTVGGSLALDISRVETPYAEVRVHALDASRQLVGQAFLPLRIRRRADADRWTIHFWNTAMVLPNALLARHLAAQASLGISGYFSLPASVSASDDTIAAADRLGIPYVVQSSGWLHAAYGTPSSGSGYPFTLTDGEEIATGRAGDTNLAASLADANVLYYRLADDEPDPPDTDVSFDDQALARFHAWLGETYGYADSVFRSEWGMSSTATTARATPLSYSDAIAAFATALATSGATPTYAPWVDHRRFMIDIFSRLPAAARSALRRGDPRALTGTSGDNRMGMWTGRDWWARGHAIDVVGRYATSTAVELDALGGRSIVWTGYDDPDPIIRYRVWTALGLGEHGLALFNENTLVNPDLSLPEVGRDLAAALLPVRRGVGGLFAASRPADDGVYVLTSPDSSAVLAIHGYERLGSWVSGSPPSQPDLGGDAREGVHDLLSAMGIGWSALAPADVEEGALERNGARVLILPMCAALSDAACTAIRRWVALGGALIADLLPGVFTAHGRMRGASITTAGAMQSSINPLDNMFGVMPGARPPITSKVVTFSAGGQFTARCVDSATTSMPTITTVTHSGTAPANISLWFRNPYEQGQTAYLGCSVFADYGAASRADRLAIERAFAALLQDLGVAPRAQIVDAGGARVELCQFHIRSSGASDLIVLLRNFLGVYDPVAEEADGELYFSTEAHTYDLDNGAYLGYGDRLPLHVSAYAFRAFARLPYRVRGVNVQAADAPRLGDSIAVTATLQVDEGASPQRHRFRLDVLAGDAPLHYLAQEVTAECGAAGFSVPSALNDPPGEWTIVVTDVNTGVQGKVRVDMGPRAAQPFPQPAPLQIGALED